MTLFAEIAGTSRRVSQTRSRNAKVTGLAACLRKLEPAEIAIGAAYLAGETRQGRSGIGHALIRDAQSDAVSEAPSLTILDVDAALARIAATSGGGSKVERTALLSALLARATADERDFLLRLLVGELRQGALESLVTDAVAEAASLPVATVRKAAMVADGIASVAARRTHRRRERSRPIRIAAHAAGGAHARAARGRHRGCAACVRDRGLRVEARRRAGAGSQAA